jgi:hypothetical protein
VVVRGCLQAIFRSRKIFQRMRNYCLYRISCTIQLLCFFFFAIVSMEPNDSAFYGTRYPNIYGELTCQINHNVAFTLPVLSLVVITILNDGTIITIAYDKVIPENRPQKWDMVEVWRLLHPCSCRRVSPRASLVAVWLTTVQVTVVSFVLGLVACLSSLILLVLCMEARGDSFIAKVRRGAVARPLCRVVVPRLDRPWLGAGGAVQAVGKKRPINHAFECNPKNNVVVDGARYERYVSWGEAQTMLYLKISLSDFFTVFSARCKSWYVPLFLVCASAACYRSGYSSPCYCALPASTLSRVCTSSIARFFERRPGYALAAALVAATGSSTLLSLWWPFPADEVAELNMTHLADAQYVDLRAVVASLHCCDSLCCGLQLRRAVRVAVRADLVRGPRRVQGVDVRIHVVVP